MPFREAHAAAGKAVRLAAEKGLSLDRLPLEELQRVGPFEADAAAVFDPLEAVKRRNAIGGTAPEAVKVQLELANRLLGE